jgi:3-carboxy-cis,cis-muconate cycloisomerase
MSFSLLTRLFGDREMAAVFSEEATIAAWLQVEAALAEAQADAGVLETEDAVAIRAAARPENVDADVLWRESRNVGYPILPLVRMIDAALAPERRGRVHYGATTQDIMDTALVLQLRAGIGRLDVLVARYGGALAAHVDAHRATVVAARTHAQQAVPTTFGAKVATHLVELTRHRERLAQARRRVLVVSLHGAGGTSAALGAEAAEVRAGLAARLDLESDDVPWHVARDGLAEMGLLFALLAASCARFAREVVELSRTEIREVGEQDGHHRGASSTMPQKENPIGSEAVIGASASAGALSSALFRAMEAGHERAAGEWQIEWQVLPQLAQLAALALASAADVAEGLRVNPDAMRRNLAADHGLLMAEAYMIALAPVLGREVAHDLVYEAAHEARRLDVPLELAVLERARARGVSGVLDGRPIPPEAYVGEPDRACESALARWRAAGLEAPRGERYAP